MSDRQTIIGVLEAALSQDPACVAQAEGSLATLATNLYFHANLFDIFADRAIATQVRWIAIVTLKNGVDKYWRKTLQNPIPVQEKDLIRPRLLSMFDEDSPLIALQYCVAVAKIARWEYPRVWPGFAEELLAKIHTIFNDRDSTDARRNTMENNTLYTLHLFVKTLSARALPLERQRMREITPLVFSVLVPIYTQRIGQFEGILLQTGSSIAENTAFFSESLPLLKSIRLCIKVLRRLWVFGHENIESADEIAQDFYATTIRHQRAFYDFLRGLADDVVPDDYMLVLRKVVLLYGKLYLDFQKYHAVQFITVPCTKSMLQWYWEQISSEATRLTPVSSDGNAASEPTLEPLLIQGLVLYKNVVKNFFYQADDGEDMDAEVARCRRLIDNVILTPALIAQMAELLMLHYIPLKPKDLERWQDDPEGWIADEDSDYWNLDVRPCAEHLFVDLVNQNRTQLVPVLANLAQQINVANSTNSPAELHYQREGKYAALGLCANDLYDYFDFCQWLQQHAAIDSSDLVVKWRIAWLIGKWIMVKFSVDQRPHAYSLLLELARPSEPLIVRVEALSSLLRCIEDWDFVPEQFAPFVQHAFERITSVLSAVTMPDSRMRMVNFLSALVQRMQREIAPHAAHILQLIPHLWESAAGENMYQMAILGLVTKVVEALGAQSTELQEFVVPLIRYSIDIDQPAHVYLIEDGIDLWLMLIRNATTLSPALITLLPLVSRLIQYSTEALRKVLKVIEGYLLVDGVCVFEKSGPAITEALHILVSDVSLTVRATAVGYNALNVLVQCVPENIGGRTLVESNILWTAFTRIVDRNEAALLLVHHAMFLSRVAVHYPTLFAKFLSMQETNLASTFTENWVGLFDDVGNVAQRRLLALGFAVAIATTNDGVLKALPLMMPVWNDIMSDTGSSLVFFSDIDDDMPDEYGETVVAENIRRQKLLSADPTHKSDIKNKLANSMDECKRLNGVSRFEAILAQVNSNDLEDFKNQLS
ncbi:hypothetical protein H4R24_000427 [Coemansia sp. RSA 988]|nr:hypothetical protein H4R24_000427 [Coemansia sp. RSA 988]